MSLRISYRKLHIDDSRSVEIPIDQFGHERRLCGGTAAARRRSGLPGYDGQIEARVSDDSDAIGFTGHAAVFDSPTWIGSASWGFEEVIARGAFTKSIAESDVRFLHNHDSNWLLARTAAGTARLAEDAVGLAVDAELAPTTQGRDIEVLLERGDLTQMSFGFRIIKQTWEWIERDDETSYERRTIQEAALYDVSTVAYPAYDDTDAGLRSEPPRGTQGTTEPPDGTRDDTPPTRTLDLATAMRMVELNERELAPMEAAQ